MTTLTKPAPPGFLRSRVGGLPRVFWVLWGGTFLSRLGAMVAPFLGLYLVTVRGLSLGQSGVVMAVLGVGTLAGQVLGGVLADRVGRRFTLTLATIASGAAMIALGYAATFPLLLAAALALGLFMDMHRPAAQAVVGDIVPAADRPRAFGLLFWAINFGYAVAMVTGGTLAERGFLWLFWINAAVCAAYGLLVWRAVPETRPPYVPGGPGFRAVLRDRVMVVYCLLTLVFTLVLMQCMTTMPLAMRADGLSARAYGLVVAANGVLIVLVQPLVTAWLSRRDSSRVMAAGCALVGVGYGLTALFDSFAGYAVAVVVWTAGEIVAATVVQAIVADLAPPDLRGRYNAVYGLAWSGGFMLAPILGTRLLERGTSVLWLTCLALGLLAAAGQLALRPAVRRRHLSSV
ncbi:MDR family MFS transporter [Actinomadura flavalba]|uniref:MDR family MFS transporter n=1 Tax=Actinomadura flavalba TaxID=1120938 RepID=UPI00037030E4|nr:MFS transporter [Actinomadura flavalba]